MSQNTVEEVTRPPVTRGVLTRMRRALPSVLVLLALLAAGYWGHHHGWKVPKFRELIQGASVAEENWCAEHGVPEAICIACRADLMPKRQLHGWCREHGVAECVLDHPQLAELAQAADVSPADLQRAQRALELKDRPRNNPLCKLHLRRIQFASAAVADKAGIDIALVGRSPIVEALTASGEILYDPTRVARLSSRAAGSVWRVDKNVGDRVRAGDMLALVDAPEVGRAKADLLQALAQLELQKTNHERLVRVESVVPGRRLQEAETALAEAETAVRQAIQTLVSLGLTISFADVQGQNGRTLNGHLQFLGLPAGTLAHLDPERTTSSLIPIVAPRDGVVVERDVVAGEVIDRSKLLFTVVDTSRMWLLLDVPLEEVSFVRPGQQVAFRADGVPDEFRGNITWVDTQVDNDTRTVKVRAEFANEQGQLRDKTFGSGQIILRQEEQAITVPSQAIHWEGCCHVAFVRDKDYLADGAYKVFHTRMIRPGVTSGERTEVIAGLLPGEVVAMAGSGALRAELLKGNLGAG